MNRLIPSRNPVLARSLAIVAMIVLLAGKYVHLGQECQGCSCNHTINGDDRPETYTCHYGCSHELPANGRKATDDKSSPHSSHDCVVCSLLLQAPEEPFVLTLPEQDGQITVTLAVLSESADSARTTQRHLRGPPIA